MHLTEIDTGRYSIHEGGIFYDLIGYCPMPNELLTGMYRFYLVERFEPNKRFDAAYKYFCKKYLGKELKKIGKGDYELR
ncbi:hypothetical protein FACS1894189_3550 [Planctomycetales bacterium]|nr:hypothetical protein FACS1894189_3550 [Planctomycetales bacterium]